MHMQKHTRSRRLVLAALLVLTLALGVALGASALSLIADWTPYSEAWSEPLAAGNSLLLDMDSVDVVLGVHDGDGFTATFEGRRAAAPNGELPTIVLKEANPGTAGRQLSLQLVWPQASLLSPSQGRLEGTLTVSLPAVALDYIDVITHSGSIQARDAIASQISLSSGSGGITAENLALTGGNFHTESFSGSQMLEGIRAQEISLSASSGSITARDLTAEGAMDATTFSGSQTYEGLTAASISLDGSSGSLAVTGLSTAGDLNANTFSGKQQYTGIEAGSMGLTASSGSIRLAQVQAAALAVDTFSGRVDGQDLTVAGQAHIGASSGRIALVGIAAEGVELTSFSGGIEASGVDADALVADTSSGSCDFAFARIETIRATTFSGDVTLTFPQGTGVDYSLDTFSGRARIDIDGAQAPEKEDNLYTGILGDGAVVVEANTSSGDLQIGYSK